LLLDTGETLPFECAFLILRRIFAVGLVKCFVHSTSCVLAHGRHPVRVAVEGKLYAGVSREVLDELGMHASTEKQCEAGVPQVMPANVGQPCAPEQGLEMAVDDVLGIKRRPLGSGEDEP
jgi:hypothetical protein